MSKWKKVKLGDVVDFTTGKLNSNAAEINGNYPFFTCSPETLKINTYAFDCEAILLAGNNANGDFNVKLYNGKFNAYQRTYVITASKYIDITYLFYSLKLSLNIFKHMSQGTATRFLTVKILNNFEIPLPPLEEQKRIAAILSSLDDKIEVNNQINKNLEEQAQAIFKSWFVDFEPFGGVMPSDWKEGTLADICSFNESSYNAKESWSFINYLDTSSITKNCISEIQNLDTSKGKIPSRAKRKVKANDIIFSTVRPNQLHYGIIKTPVEKMLVSTGFTVISARQNISYHRIYLQVTTKENIEHLNTIAEQSTSTFPAIKAEDISCLETYILPQTLEKKFFDIMEPIFERIELCSIESKRLCEVRNILLPKLISGEIKA